MRKRERGEMGGRRREIECAPTSKKLIQQNKTKEVRH